MSLNHYSKCSECGLEGDFCGYHNLGVENKSLCMACAEAPVEVYRIALHGEGGGCVAPTLLEAIDTITALVGEMDSDTGYDIGMEKMTRKEVVAMPEFQGF